MIYYNSQTKSFLLSGRNYSYCMYINRAGLLQHLYWGKKIGAAEGDFEGERACHERDITIKYHCLKDVGMVRRVTVNGEEVPFKRTKREAGAFPLDTSLSAPDAYVVGVSFLADVAKEQSVVFFCE